jgi:hypothetical protein
VGVDKRGSTDDAEQDRSQQTDCDIGGPNTCAEGDSNLPHVCRQGQGELDALAYVTQINVHVGLADLSAKLVSRALMTDASFIWTHSGEKKVGPNVHELTVQFLGTHHCRCCRINKSRNLLGEWRERARCWARS